MLTALLQAQEQAVSTSGIAAAIQAQGEAAAKTMAGLTAIVQQLAEQQTVMTKAVINFIFAQRQANWQSSSNANRRGRMQMQGRQLS